MSWIDELERNGYVLLSGIVGTSRLDRHLSGAQHIFERAGAGHNLPPAQLPARRRSEMDEDLVRLHYEDQGTAGEDTPLAFSPEIQGAVRAAFGDEPVLSWARTAFWEAGGRSPHFDTAALSTTPTRHALRSWCALEDIDRGSGVFFVYPGTHLSLPEEICDEVYRRPGVRELFAELTAEYAAHASRPEAVHSLPEWKRLHAAIWPAICAAVERRAQNLERVTFPLRKGDLVLFNPRLVHGTMPRTDLSLPRKSLICEWRAQSSRIYFLTEHFGTAIDRRHEPGTGRPATERLVRTRWGAYTKPVADETS